MLKTLINNVKKISSIIKPSSLDIIKSSGLIPFYIFTRKSGLMDFFKHHLPERRNRLLTEYPAYEIITAIVMNVIAGLTRPSHHKYHNGNESFMRQIFSVGRVPHFTTLIYYIKRNADILVNPLKEVMLLWSLGRLKKIILQKKMKYVTVDVDQTADFIYGHQECAQKGYNALKRPDNCFQFSVWTIRELKLLIWAELRPGNTHCAKDILPLLKRIIPVLQECGVYIRFFADSGYESIEAFDYLDSRGVGFMIVERQRKEVKASGRRAKNKTFFVKLKATLKERKYQRGKNTYRRVYLQAHEAYDPETGQLFFKEFFSDEFTNVFVTNMQYGLKHLCQLYREHAQVECIIEELKNDFAAVKSRAHNFSANECWAQIAALSYNLKTLYCHGLNKKQSVVPKLSTFRRTHIDIPGYIANNGGSYVLRVAREGYSTILNACRFACMEA